MKTKIFAIAVVGVVIFMGILAYVSQPKGIITSADPSLLPEQKTMLEEQLREAQNSVEEITSDMTAEEKAKRYFKVARTQAILGNYQEAKKGFNKVISIKKNFPLYLEYYNLLTSMRDFKGARDVARAGLEIFPINIDIWRSLIALEKSQLGADANRLEELYLEAFRKSEEQPDLSADVARYYEEQGNYSEALKYWKVASQKAPEVPFYLEQVRRLEAK